MPIRAWVDEDDKLARFEIVGAWTTDEMVGAVKDALDVIGDREGFDVLSDHTRTGEPATPDQIRVLVSHLTRKGSALGGRRAAMVVANETSYGMMRMLSAHTEKIGIEVGIFWSVEAALGWLRPGVNSS